MAEERRGVFNDKDDWLSGGLAAGMTGIGAIALNALTNRRPGVSLASGVGQELLKNKEELTKMVAPIFSRFSDRDEKAWAALELCLTDGYVVTLYGRVRRKDVLTQFLDAVGVWACDRLRGIAIDIPNPKKYEGDKERSVAYTDEDFRVKFIDGLIDDILYYGEQPDGHIDVEFGINKVIADLKIRNQANPDTATAKLAEWWNAPRDTAGFESVARKLEAWQAKKFPKAKDADGEKSAQAKEAKTLGWFARLFR